MKVAAVIGVFSLAIFVASVSLTSAADELERTIVIKNHQFTPAEIEVPAGARVKLIIDNQDPTAEEFESLDLRAEKVIPGSSKGSVWIGPLTAGEYKFMGEFHQETAQGRVVAK